MRSRGNASKPVIKPDLSKSDQSSHQSSRERISKGNLVTGNTGESPLKEIFLSKREQQSKNVYSASVRCSRSYLNNQPSLRAYYLIVGGVNFLLPENPVNFPLSHKVSDDRLKSPILPSLIHIIGEVVFGVLDRHSSISSSIVLL